MNEETRFVAKRVGNIAAMAVGLVLLAVFYAVYYNLLIDKILSILLLVGIFFPMFVLLIVSERKEGRLNQNYKTGYSILRTVFLIVLLCYGVFSFLPAYCAPVLLMSIFLTGASTPVIGMTGGIFLNILLLLVRESSYYELTAYILLTMAGCFIAMWLPKRQYRRYFGMIIFVISFTIPALHYYLANYQMKYSILIFGVVSGILSIIITMTLFDKTSQNAKTELEQTLKDIIEPEYPLAKDIRNFSELDYTHAQNVSKTAYQCALLIGADADIAAAAGFYYRLGKLEGEPFVKNGVMLAETHCFPLPVIEILREYNGEERLPQTKESAIVHLVDAVMTKFELLDKDTVSNSWNHDIVIYQTMDEKSSSGIYDESGLSMNHYLKLREYLVKGVRLE